jgi:transposase
MAHREELIGLIIDKEHPLQTKHAFKILTERHPKLRAVSYTFFKRYARNIRCKLYPEKTTCCIEVTPGHQLQIDYGKVGLLFDPVAKKKRALYAFIGTLSHSRHKYVEFTFKQCQQSFVQSHINMFQFFGGVPRTIVIDNLKAGVIRPDLYDPSLNRAYLELAEYYDCFIDPAWVATPKDKPKVERDVQTIRDQYRKMILTEPSLILPMANISILNWLVDTYGTRKHGSTHIEPMKLFNDTEQPALLSLPPEPFHMAQWKEATCILIITFKSTKKSTRYRTGMSELRLWSKLMLKPLKSTTMNDLSRCTQ